MKNTVLVTTTAGGINPNGLVKYLKDNPNIVVATDSVDSTVPKIVEEFKFKLCPHSVEDLPAKDCRVDRQERFKFNNVKRVRK